MLKRKFVMGAAVSCGVCAKQINDSAVWHFEQRTFVCVNCFDESTHTDFVLENTKSLLENENKLRIAAEKEIHRLLPKEVRDAKSARFKFESVP